MSRLLPVKPCGRQARNAFDFIEATGDVTKFPGRTLKTSLASTITPQGDLRADLLLVTIARATQYQLAAEDF
jgi:hypothetical protein